MRKLEDQFNILKHDVTGLVNTTDMFQRLQRDEKGVYHLIDSYATKTYEDRVSRILGAILPRWSIESIKDLLRSTRDNSLPEGYEEIETTLTEEHRKCVTNDTTLLRILMILRIEGVINFKQTPVCGQKDPVVHIREIISSSHIGYKDTLITLLNLISEKNNTLFISDDPEETPGEKLDRAVMLLSLLSPEELREHMNFSRVIEGTSGNFCAFFMNSIGIAKALPLIMAGCPKVLELFKDVKASTHYVDSAESVVDDFREDLEKCPLKATAFDDLPYKNVLLHCANAGVSISGWAERVANCIDGSRQDVNTWMLEHIDSNVANLIMSREGYYTISLMGRDIKRLESSPEFHEFRKYLVSNGFLKDVWHLYLDDYYTDVAFFEIDTRRETNRSEYIRFFNFDNEYYGREYCNLGHLICGFDSSRTNPVYRFVSIKTIEDEAYRLDMNLYNASEFARCSNPVFIKDLLTPVRGIAGSYSDSYFEPIYEDGSAYVSLCEDPLDNYSDFIKADFAYRENGDKKFATDSALFLRNSWPMKPTWITCKNLGTRGGLVISSEMAKSVCAYKVNQAIVSPWYLAYKLSKATSQFNLRKNQDGILEEAQLMRIYIDLPSLEEQKRELEEVINQEIERKKRQVGSAQALFDLSHSIALPAYRMQSLLGNLQDMSNGNPEVFTQLKKVADNFDYILRLIDSTSKDFSGTKYPLKECKILPILEHYISTFSSLPFGIDPTVEKARIDTDTKVRIDKSLFTVMLDNILRNAYRHGFDKKVSPENKVSIELDTVKYNGRDYLNISVCNSGKAVEDGFTIYDYVSRGRYGESTGNTGQGGYDIYQIVKKFDGYLGMRSSEKWNFIIDILVPVYNVNLESIKTPYEYGTLL